MGLPTGIANRLARVLAALVLTATFVTICWAEPIGVYLAFVAIILSIPLVGRSALLAALSDRGVWCFLLAFALLSVAFVLGAQRPDDGMAFVDFLALPLVLPAFALFVVSSSGRAPLIVSTLAALGCLVAYSVGFYDVNFKQMERAAGGTSPIFFSDMAIILGFFCLLGMILERHWWRWLFAAGHAVAVGAAIFGGTRGALVAEIAILLLFSIYCFFWWDRPWKTRIVTVGGVIATTLLFVVSLFDLSRASTTITVASEAFGQGAISDVNTSIRLKFWAAGLQSFLESPVYGHSWWNRFAAAIPYMPASLGDAISHDKTAHLHNDIINFASGAGLMGVFAYLLLLAGPIVSVWFSPRNERWRFRLFAAVGFAAAYFVMGLTDTMFVFEIPKSMFVLCSAVIMAFFLDAPPTALGKARSHSAS